MTLQNSVSKLAWRPLRSLGLGQFCPQGIQKLRGPVLYHLKLTGSKSTLTTPSYGPKTSFRHWAKVWIFWRPIFPQKFWVSPISWCIWTSNDARWRDFRIWCTWGRDIEQKLWKLGFLVFHITRSCYGILAPCKFCKILLLETYNFVNCSHSVLWNPFEIEAF